MSAVPASLCSTLMFVGVFVFVCADQKTITAESGQNVTLTCRAPNNNIIVVKWIRADLGDEYVLLYQDGRFVPDEQHPSFKNRVDLQDRQMKDGDVSLILRDVKINDTGVYMCSVVMEGVRTWTISFIYLIVDPPGQPEGYPVWMVGLGSILLVIFIFLIHKIIQQQKTRKRKFLKKF
ncbi:programmed cell death 1 ligand 1-like [Oreochromis niloticus]|uniref:programmed cell death 1 ligand 1-like n=1 Tax=Oreochromis niloticus TaxID=8128 RepID=UPI000DF163FF|nr:programmed cell death 1 ligand 1-like [Oreochromis niloticus]